jgi:Tol biopolymer transport system component
VKNSIRRIGITGFIASVLAVIGITILPLPVNAWNHTEIEWKTYSTEHFEIHYHPGAEWTAQQTAIIAEEIYPPVSEFYGFEFKDKFHIVISDKEDESQGATYYYLNKIEISATELEFHFRGTSNWLRNVLTHEFTHMIQVQSAMKMSRRIPAFFIQAIDFEEEKRPDVITGYPTFQMSLPVAGEIVPNWFAEGTAQYMNNRKRYDFWDSHRDMLLRTATLNDQLLSIDEMGVFGKNSLGAEMVYNQGYSLVRYIADQYGDDKLSELTQALSSWRNITFNGACKKVIGIDEGRLYRDWKAALEARYGKIASERAEGASEGRIIADKGFLNLFPVSGDRGDIFFLSNQGRDFSELDLVQISTEGERTTLSSGITSRPHISPDGRLLCYSKGTTSNKYAYNLNDIFIYDLDSKKEKRLTRGVRTTEPVWSPDGERIACVTVRDGTERLLMVAVDDGSERVVTDHIAGRQYFGMSWGERGILASRFDDLSRDIVLIDPETGAEQVVIGSGADERDPFWTKDGGGFFYSSDRTGIFNIYYHDMNGAPDLRITDCIGGAFNPSPAGDGCLFAGYGAGGYDIRTVDNWRDTAVEAREEDIDRELQERRAANIPAWKAGERAEEVQEIDLAGESKDFNVKYTSLYLFPAFMVYDGKLRLGLYFDSRDLLGRQSVYGGGTFGEDKEFDFHFGFEIRQFKPTFSFNVFRSRKYYTTFLTLDDGLDYKFDYRYDLWDAFFTTSFELTQTTFYKRHEIALQYNHAEYGLNLQQWDLLDVEIGWTYYKGNEFSLLYNYRDIRKELDADINPRKGRSLYVGATYSLSQLDSGEFEYGLQPIYDDNKFGRYEFIYEEHIPLPYWRHSFSLMLRGGVIDNLVDSFFYIYMGSRDRVRGYSYYSIGGRKGAMARLTYRFPILRNINRQVLNIYLSSIYAAVYADAGKAWNEDEIEFRNNVKDIGYEIRAKGFTFYTYPLAVSFEAAYGFDEIEYYDPTIMDQPLIEGKSWRYYGSVMFSF